MDKEFVKYEIALELKELGFNEDYFGFYWFNGSSNRWVLETKEYEDEYSKTISAPTFSQAFRWFREKCDLHGKVGIYHFIENTYCYNIVSKNVPHYIHKESQFETYEEAELECLRKLIQIVKEQK